MYKKKVFSRSQIILYRTRRIVNILISTIAEEQHHGDKIFLEDTWPAIIDGISTILFEEYL